MQVREIIKSVASTSYQDTRNAVYDALRRAEDAHDRACALLRSGSEDAGTADTRDELAGAADAAYAAAAALEDVAADAAAAGVSPAYLRIAAYAAADCRQAAADCARDAR